MMLEEITVNPSVVQMIYSLTLHAERHVEDVIRNKKKVNKSFHLRHFLKKTTFGIDRLDYSFHRF